LFYYAGKKFIGFLVLFIFLIFSITINLKNFFSFIFSEKRMKIMKKILVFLVFGIFLTGGVMALTQITDCQGLQDIKLNLSEDYVLINDIDCSDTINWNSGAGFESISQFQGSLDGQKYTISGFYMERPYVGLFRSLCGDVSITNLKFTNASVTVTGDGEGGVLLTGWECSPSNSLIDNVEIEGSFYGGIIEYTGGLAGNLNVGINLTNSKFIGYVEGAGGLIGQNDGNVLNSSFEGFVNGTGVDIWWSGPNCWSSGFKDCIPGLTGGFAGWNFGTIRTSYSTGKVEGLNNVGGFVGGDEYIDETWRGEIFDSYSTANVTGLEYKGGFVGYNRGGDIINSFSTGTVKDRENLTQSASLTLMSQEEASTTGGFLAYLDDEHGYDCYDSFWDIETSGITESACSVNGKTSSEMKNPSTYSTWDPDLWFFPSGDYPCLVWEEGCLVLDSDGDGIPDADDKCPNTEGEQLVYGCSCEQVLELKPGEDTAENRQGCSQGLLNVFENAIGWAKDLF
jgi:hypothetical protein